MQTIINSTTSKRSYPSIFKRFRQLFKTSNKSNSGDDKIKENFETTETPLPTSHEAEGPSMNGTNTLPNPSIISNEVVHNPPLIPDSSKSPIRYQGHRVCGQSNHYKIIHFVRHAQGHHNVAGLKGVLEYLREDLEDARLTTLGIQQCKDLNRKISKKLTSVELVAVSPLNRTLETALHCFDHLIDPKLSEHKASIEMTKLSKKVPFIAVESLREQTGMHPCDRRVSVQVKEKEFPQIDFRQITHNEDPYYSKHGSMREPEESVLERIAEFMDWLEARPEKEIAVVSHGTYLSCMFEHILEIKHSRLRKPNQSSIKKNESEASVGIEETVDDAELVEEFYFKNCELRTVIISFPHKDEDKDEQDEQDEHHGA